MEKYFRESSADEKEKAPDYLPYLNAATLTEDDLKTGVLLEKMAGGRTGGWPAKNRGNFWTFFARAGGRGGRPASRDKRVIEKTAGEEADEDFLEAQMAEKIGRRPALQFLSLPEQKNRGKN